MEVVSKIKEILKEKVPADVVDNLKETDPISALGIDSLDLVECVMGIENEFGIEISTEEMSKFVTLGDMVAVINQKVK